MRRVQEAVQQLQAWDGRMEADSVGPTLFDVFFAHFDHNADGTENISRASDVVGCCARAGREPSGCPADRRRCIRHHAHESCPGSFFHHPKPSAGREGDHKLVFERGRNFTDSWQYDSWLYRDQNRFRGRGDFHVVSRRGDPSFILQSDAYLSIRFACHNLASRAKLRAYQTANHRSAELARSDKTEPMRCLVGL